MKRTALLAILLSLLSMLSGVAAASMSDLTAAQSSAFGAIRGAGSALEHRAAIDHEVKEVGRQWIRENTKDGIVEVLVGRLEGAEASGDEALQAVAKRLLQSTYRATEKQELGNGVGSSVLSVDRAIAGAVSGVSEGLSYSSRSKATAAVRQTIRRLVALLGDPDRLKAARAYSQKNRFNGTNYPPVRIDMDQVWPIALVVFAEPATGQYIAFYGRSGSYD